MQRHDWPANNYMIYAAAQGPWHSWIQVLSKNNKTSGKKCYKPGWNHDPSSDFLCGPHTTYFSSVLAV
jgi:hypothetical protein